MADFVAMVMIVVTVTVLPASMMVLLVTVLGMVLHTDVAALLLRVEVVVVCSASGVGELPAAARPRVKVPARNHLEAVAAHGIE